MDWLYVILVLSSSLALFARGKDGALAVSLNATVEILGPLNSLILWQLPVGGRVVQKVLVIFCSGSDADSDPMLGPYAFWDQSPNCPLCSGQPESRKIVIDALSRDYAVIAPAPLGFPNGRWSDETWPKNASAITNALVVISTWIRSHGLENLPTVGLGISGGGEAISTVGLYTGFFESIAIMISHGVDQAFHAATKHYPPTLFVCMPKDDDTEVRTNNAMQMLHSEGVKTRKVHWYEQPMTPDWFTFWIPWMPLSTSEAIVSTFQEYHILDENNLLLSVPVEGGDWLDILHSKNVLPKVSSKHDQKLLESHILQEMSVAFAAHITLSRKDDEIFGWFEDKSFRSIGGDMEAAFKKSV